MEPKQAIGTNVDSTRARQIKTPVMKVVDEGLLKMFDGVVPHLCADEWSRLSALWSGRQIINTKKAKTKEQAFLAGIGNTTISDTQLRIEKMVAARPCLKESYDGRAALDDAATALQGFRLQLQLPARFAKEITMKTLREIEKVCTNLDVRLEDTLADFAAREQVEHSHPSFACPIGKEMMRDPVVAADGFTYERKWIEKHLGISGQDLRGEEGGFSHDPFAGIFELEEYDDDDDLIEAMPDLDEDILSYVPEIPFFAMRYTGARSQEEHPLTSPHSSSSASLPHLTPALEQDFFTATRRFRDMHDFMMQLPASRIAEEEAISQVSQVISEEEAISQVSQVAQVAQVQPASRSETTSSSESVPAWSDLPRVLMRGYGARAPEEPSTPPRAMHVSMIQSYGISGQDLRGAEGGVFEPFADFSRNFSRSSARAEEEHPATLPSSSPESMLQAFNRLDNRLDNRFYGRNLPDPSQPEHGGSTADARHSNRDIRARHLELLSLLPQDLALELQQIELPVAGTQQVAQELDRQNLPSPLPPTIRSGLLNQPMRGPLRAFHYAAPRQLPVHNMYSPWGRREVKSRMTSPMTNIALANRDLVPNTTLRTVINELVEAATRSILEDVTDDARDQKETRRQLQTTQNDLARYTPSSY